MKFESINKRYTEKVAEYLAQGYVINTATMSGHQGEISKIDLTNGTEIIRVMLQTVTLRATENGSYYHFDTVVLTVGVAQAENRCTPNSSDAWETIWNEKLDILYTETFYEIGRGRYEKWYGTREEAMAQQDKQNKRYEARRISDREDITDKPEVRKTVIKAVRRVKGMKSASASEIKMITRRHSEKGIRYEVIIRNKTVVLRAA